MEKQSLCKHCVTMPFPHKYICNCGHEHNDHGFGSGCRKCRCDRYDQSQLLTAESWRDKEKKLEKKVKDKIEQEEIHVNA